jgi:hypothetical protein
MPKLPWIHSAFRHILHPPAPPDATAQWYINDHCFIVAPDNHIHWFGITNPYPDDVHQLYGAGSHRHIGHASAPHPFGPWTAHEHAFMLPPDTQECVGACFAVQHDGTYYLIYGYNTGFSMAVSPDMFHWEKLDRPDINLGIGTRDPCVLGLENGTYLLYAAAGHEGVGAVALAESSNLLNWTPQPAALVSDVPGVWGPLESPFVHKHEGTYYLFVNHSHRQYEETLVFSSDDPYHFDWNQPLCTLFSHAAEIFTWEGKTYISHCGIEDRHWGDTGAPYGLWLAELGWAKE